MSISSDRYLASHGWDVYQDAEGGYQSYVNCLTGELCDQVYAPLRPGSIILTPEEQNRRREYWQRMMEDRDREKQKQYANLRRKNGPKYFFVSCEESLWAELEPATATRLIYLASHLNYDGKLMLTERTMLRRKDLSKILGLSPSLISSFWNAVHGRYLFEAENGALSMNPKAFCRGELRQGGQFQFFYIAAIRALYHSITPRQHKHLGYVFRMLPYVNHEFNILCHDSSVVDREKLDLLSVADFCEKIDYHRNNRYRLVEQLSQLRFQTDGGMEQLCSFQTNGRLDTAEIHINPHLFYRGMQPELAKKLGGFDVPASFCETPNQAS